MQHRLRLPLIFILAVGLVGCASRPPSSLIATGQSVVGAQEVSVFTISTRATSDIAGEIYNGERGVSASTRIVTVSIPQTHKTGNIEWPEQGLPEQEFAVTNIETPSRSGVRKWFREADTDGHVMIFVHGYNVRYGEAVYRLAQIVHDMEIDAAPVLFTWPSRGTVTSYFYDKESATLSRDTLEQIIRIAAASSETKSITIFAHSMGSWVAMEALRQSSIREGKLDPKIRNIILAAPDIDVDLFQQQFNALGKDRPDMTLLLSHDDKALSLSRMLAGNVTRVGGIDVNSDTYATKMAAIKGVKIVDLSELEDGGNMHHSKFAETSEAIALLGQEFAGHANASGLSRQAEAVIIGLSHALDGANKKAIKGIGAP